MNPLLKAEDADPQNIADELHRLAESLDNGSAQAQKLKHTEQTEVGEESTETLVLEYTLSAEFHGIDPLVHDSGLIGDERYTDEGGDA